MGFSDKTPKYQACLKFLDAISPKSKDKKKEEVKDLTSQDGSPNKMEILFLETKKRGKAAKT